MTREKVKQLLPIIKAFSEGKTIQVSTILGWSDRKELELNALETNPELFRIKPSPTYRPFANAEECWQEMQKHQPFGWIKSKDKTVPSKYMFINNITNKHIVIWATDYTFDEMLQCYTFADGSVFGILENES